MKMELSDEVRKRIGKRIYALRNNQGITQQQLADAAGLKQPHIVRIEQGKYSVGLDTLDAIANALGCKVDLVANRRKKKSDHTA